MSGKRGKSYERAIGPPIELDVSDPIDRVLYQTRIQVTSGNLRAEEEADWIDGIQTNDRKSNLLLVANYRPITAAVGYAYKGPGRNSKKVVFIGARALLLAALMYEQGTSRDFIEAAVGTMHVELQSRFGFRPEGSNVIYTEKAEQNICDFYRRISIDGLDAQYRDYKASLET